MILSKNTYAATWCQKGYIGIIGGGGSRKLGTGGGRKGGRLRQNQVLAVCTERSTGNIPAPSLIVMAVNGGRAPGAPPPPQIRAWPPDVSSASANSQQDRQQTFQTFLLPCVSTSFPRNIQDFLKGGVKTFTSTHTPLGHCPRDVIRPPVN